MFLKCRLTVYTGGKTKSLKLCANRAYILSSAERAQELFSEATAWHLDLPRGCGMWWALAPELSCFSPGYQKCTTAAQEGTKVWMHFSSIEPSLAWLQPPCGVRRLRLPWLANCHQAFQALEVDQKKRGFKNCVKLGVVSPYPWRPPFRDAAAPQPHPAVSLRGRRGACEPGAAFRPVSCFSLGKGRKPEQPGAELRVERTPTRPTCSFASVRCARAGSPPRRAAAAALAEGGGGGEKPAAAAAIAKWRRP